MAGRDPGADSISKTVHPRSQFDLPSTPGLWPRRRLRCMPWFAGAPPRRPASLGRLTCRQSHFAATASDERFRGCRGRGHHELPSRRARNVMTWLFWRVSTPPRRIRSCAIPVECARPATGHRGVVSVHLRRAVTAYASRDHVSSPRALASTAAERHIGYSARYARLTPMLLSPLVCYLVRHVAGGSAPGVRCFVCQGPMLMNVHNSMSMPASPLL